MTSNYMSYKVEDLSLENLKNSSMKYCASESTLDVGYLEAQKLGF